MDSFFVHISKIGLKALYYKALSHFLATILSTMPITLSDKAEKEMSEAIKVMAVSAFTEKSQNLIPLDYVAALVGCPYQHTANFIVKQPSFQKA